VDYSLSRAAHFSNKSQQQGHPRERFRVFGKHRGEDAWDNAAELTCSRATRVPAYLSGASPTILPTNLRTKTNSSGSAFPPVCWDGFHTQVCQDDVFA
jgi:hypothetical protein